MKFPIKYHLSMFACIACLPAAVLSQPLPVQARATAIARDTAEQEPIAPENPEKSDK